MLSIIIFYVFGKISREPTVCNVFVIFDKLSSYFSIYRIKSAFFYSTHKDI